METAPKPRAAKVSWQERFLAMLPAIQTHARVAFGHLDPEACEDALQEVVANCLVAFARLVQRGRIEVAYPSALARFAVSQFRDGRRVGNRRNGRDVLSPYAQKRNGIVVERLDRFRKDESEWAEALVEDQRTPVLDQVAFRCDFPAWLDTLPRRNRQIAEALSLGHSTSAVAKRFKVSPGRISQLRQELRESWREFQGETPVEQTNLDAA
jgi:hypothetical protein